MWVKTFGILLPFPSHNPEEEEEVKAPSEPGFLHDDDGGMSFGDYFSDTLVPAGNAVTQGKDVEKTVVERVPDTVLKFWCLWAPMQFINFRFVSQTFNMPMVQVLNLIWTTYLSALDNNRKDDELNEFSKSS